jgi:hypothetical protein
MSGTEPIAVAAVTWELSEGTRRSKRKIFPEDVSNGVLKGKDLRRQLNAESAPLVSIEILDSSQSVHVPLDGSLLEEAIIPRFGTRLQINVRQKESNATETLAIMGRFYSYDSAQGVTIAGQQLRVQEIANQENAGTGVNVWDGALLL